MPETRITAEPGMPLIIVTREFDAERDLVFRAHVDPRLIVRWMGPRDATMIIDSYDVRDGGCWRYRSVGADGAEHCFHGVFHGTPSPDAIVQTFEFDGMPGRVSLHTWTFTDLGGRTLVRSVSSFQSVGDRDAMVAAGMERGVTETAERLAELLASKEETPWEG